MSRLMGVGELAQQTGLTVRTLHHYDEIGLVKPSGRSESGYRLYGPSDLKRLHVVLALRQLGFALPQIAQVLAEADATPMQELVAAQIEAIDQDIAQAQRLRTQLALLQQLLNDDESQAPGEALLDTLRLMEQYQRHFPDHELPPLLRRWHRLARRRRQLVTEVEAAMAQALPADAPIVQALAQQWMDWSMTLTEGSLDTALRWADLHAKAPDTARQQGLNPALLTYIGAAIGLCLAALRRHLSDAELGQIDKTLAPRWAEWAAQVSDLMSHHGEEAFRTPQARALLAQWDALAADMAGQDPALTAKLQRAYASEPLLQHGHVVTPAMRAFMAQVRALAHAQAGEHHPPMG